MRPSNVPQWSTCYLSFVLIALAFESRLDAQTVNVSKPTNIDWTFVLSNRSLVDPPQNWIGEDYQSTAQQYEIGVPANGHAKKQPLPLILFVSPSNKSSGVREWTAAVRRGSMIVASPLGAGNQTPGPERVRIILDVLADIRSKYSIDPDRTYIGGFSGGGRIACMIAFALWPLGNSWCQVMSLGR